MPSVFMSVSSITYKTSNWPWPAEKIFFRVYIQWGEHTRFCPEVSEVCWNVSSWLTCCLSLTSCSFCQAITRLISAGSVPAAARVVPPADIFPSCSFTPGKLGTPKQSPLFVGTTTFRGSTSGRDWLGLVASLQKHNKKAYVFVYKEKIGM